MALTAGEDTHITVNGAAPDPEAEYDPDSINHYQEAGMARFLYVQKQGYICF